MGYISAQRVESERSKSFPVSISLQTKGKRKYVRVPGTVKYPPSSGKSSGSCSKSRCAQGCLVYSFRLKMKWAIFRPSNSKVSVRKVLLCPFNCKARPSGVSLKYAEVENIPPCPGSRAQVGQNHDARKAVPATLSVLK